MREVNIGKLVAYTKPQISDFDDARDAITEINRRREAGIPIYYKYTDGDRKGSIGKFVFEDDKLCVFEVSRTYGGGGFNAHIRNFFGTMRWDGRANKVKVTLIEGWTVWLPDYEGPTVWEKFDAKAAKENRLSDPGCTDIDGKPLSVGDQVLYINARYGSAMELDHGVITSFEALANSRRIEIIVLITNKDGVESRIKNPATMIYRKS